MGKFRTRKQKINGLQTGKYGSRREKVYQSEKGNNGFLQRESLIKSILLKSNRIKSTGMNLFILSVVNKYEGKIRN